MKLAEGAADDLDELHKDHPVRLMMIYDEDEGCSLD